MLQKISPGHKDRCMAQVKPTGKEVSIQEKRAGRREAGVGPPRGCRASMRPVGRLWTWGAEEQAVGGSLHPGRKAVLQPFCSCTQNVLGTARRSPCPGRKEARGGAVGVLRCGLPAGSALSWDGVARATVPTVRDPAQSQTSADQAGRKAAKSSSKLEKWGRIREGGTELQPAVSPTARPAPVPGSGRITLCGRARRLQTGLFPPSFPSRYRPSLTRLSQSPFLDTPAKKIRLLQKNSLHTLGVLRGWWGGGTEGPGGVSKEAGSRVEGSR